MKFPLIAAALFVAAPAMAQTKPESPTPEARACEVALNEERQTHASDAATAFRIADDNVALKKQIADLTKERDDLKAQIAATKAEAKPADPAPAPKKE